jgi:hypothetical protein
MNLISSTPKGFFGHGSSQASERIRETDPEADMVDVTDPTALREAFMQLNARLSQRENQIQTLITETQILTRRLAMSASIPTITRTSTSLQRRSSLVDTRLLGKLEGFSGDRQKFPAWSFKFKDYPSAIDVRYQTMIAITEQATSPILHIGLSDDEVQLSTKFYYALVMLSSGAALDKCHNAGVYEGFETWRNFVKGH